MKQPLIETVDDAAEYWSDEGCFILELSNDSEDPHVSIARARVAAGVSTRRHRLEGTAERYVILQGQAEVRIDGAPPRPVGPGAIVRIPPGVAQSIANTGIDDLVFLCICTPRFQQKNYQSLE